MRSITRNHKNDLSKKVLLLIFAAVSALCLLIVAVAARQPWAWPFRWELLKIGAAGLFMAYVVFEGIKDLKK